MRFSIQVGRSEYAVQFHSVSTPRICSRNTVKTPVSQVERKCLRESEIPHRRTYSRETCTVKLNYPYVLRSVVGPPITKRAKIRREDVARCDIIRHTAIGVGSSEFKVTFEFV